ncbi:threonine dehydratase catabolic [Bordetella pertussis]|nr:threonine dehydratase catabolic [Bordetella pertussis]
MIDLAAIQTARDILRGQVLNTPFTHSRTLSDILGAEIWLKFENLQFTASFKERGALNRMLNLTEAERAAGVIAVSAGNHAQGVAYHAQRMGVPAVIVMPRFTPTVKVANTRRFGAEVVLAGDTFDDAKARGYELARERGLVMIHPYDDPAVIAGQGTVALEMLQARPDLDAIVVGIGGGGLIAGIATAAKAIKPDIEIIGVQTERFPSMYAAVKGVAMESGHYTIAEGIAVKSPGTLTQEIVTRLVDHIELVNESDIEHAIVVLLEIEKTVVEGAGAAGLAALLRLQERRDERFRGKRLGAGAHGRQHRSPDAGRADRARYGARRAPGAHPGRPARPAGRAGAGHQADRRRARQHYRGASPARLHHLASAQCRGRFRAADAWPWTTSRKSSRCSMPRASRPATTITDPHRPGA